MDKLLSETSAAGTDESSHIGELIKDQKGPLPTDPDETATTSKITREELGDYLGGPVVLPRDVFNETARMHNEEAREKGHPSQIVSTIHGGSSVDEEGNLVYKQPRVYPIPSDTQRSTRRQRSRSVDSQDSSRLSSPPPTMKYGGSEIFFPSQTPRERAQSPLPSTNYEGSRLGLPLSALPEDPFSVLRASAGIIAQRYIQSEENISQHATKEEGMEETLKVYTPIPRKFEISDSDDEVMTEVEWRDGDPYMMPMKKGKRCNNGKGVKRPATPKRPIPNMPQTPSRKKLEFGWAKPAESLASENEPADLGKFIGEYLQHTNGLRDFMVGQERHDANYDVWCQQQSQHIAARQNHTDAAIMSVRKIAQNVQVEVELEREYAAERAEKLDERLSKIEKRLAKIAPVNMAKTIENAMRDCMEGMMDQLTDRVVKRFENAAEEDRKKGEIRRGKQVEVTPEEECMSNIEFEPGATFSEEENEKVARVIEKMQVDEQELEGSKHAPVIPLGEKKQEFPRFVPSGQVTIAKRPEIAPAVPEQKKKNEAKKPEVKDVRGSPLIAVMIHGTEASTRDYHMELDTISHEAKHLLAHQLMSSARGPLAG